MERSDRWAITLIHLVALVGLLIYLIEKGYNDGAIGLGMFGGIAYLLLIACLWDGV